MRVLTGFSGWLAALFLLGFVGSAFVWAVENAILSLAVGAVMILGAYTILRHAANEFVEHLALALSLAGQVLVFWGLFRINTPGWSASTWLWIALLELALTWWMPSFVHRVFSTFLAAGALSTAFMQMHVPYVIDSVLLLAMAWIWLHLFRYPRQLARLRAVGYGLALALIPLKGSVLFQAGGTGWRAQPFQVESWLQPWMAELLTVAVMIYVVWQLLQRYQYDSGDRFSLLVLAATLLIALFSLEAPGLATALVILLLGFAVGNRVLLGLGIAALLFFISSYYYLLDITLLAKAGHLLLIGLALLMLRWLAARYLFNKGTTDVA
ncbi:DUF4401 domain-containing protein [Thiohalophilus sp.]|uniref:DUF4401 domain-containing protein n=1 Tax=Thiohalophilus sp. TaxID=3028392 RepID=UPI002ACD2588|nr:DUF4401 domain-containing protein [Thiohalophilus sp.]MDZ7804195.1 DUF4401 domain-containing protein [Thiohalophilus sp.]